VWRGQEYGEGRHMAKAGTGRGNAWDGADINLGKIRNRQVPIAKNMRTGWHSGRKAACRPSRWVGIEGRMLDWSTRGG
jgi:hypothetical protein